MGSGHEFLFFRYPFHQAPEEVKSGIVWGLIGIGSKNDLKMLNWWFNLWESTFMLYTVI